MRADATQSVEDPILVIGMPECVFVGSNPGAVGFFEQRGVDLWSTHAVGRSLNDVFGAPAAALARHCVMQPAYAALQQGAPIISHLIPFHYHNGNGERTYEVFVSHTTLDTRGFLICRLLPIPWASFHVIAKDYDSDLGRYPEMPVGVHMRVEGLLQDDCHFSVTDLEDHKQWDSVYRICRDLADYLEDSEVYEQCWKRALNQIPENLVAALAAPVREIVFRPDRVRSIDLVKYLHNIRQHALDAPCFTERVLPSLWNRIQSDCELRFLPTGMTQHCERDQYLRARLNFSELEAQDRYLGWVTLSDGWTIEQLRSEG